MNITLEQALNNAYDLQCSATGRGRIACTCRLCNNVLFAAVVNDTISYDIVNRYRSGGGTPETPEDKEEYRVAYAYLIEQVKMANIEEICQIMTD